MRSQACGFVCGVLAATCVIWPAGAQQPPETYGIGRTATAGDVGSWGPAIGPDGTGLPDGGATAGQGRIPYQRHCARCHGARGVDGPDDALAGGLGTLSTDAPRKTVGSYWPFATTLWDYVNRAMPFDRPGSLTADEVYGVVAYVLFLNQIIGEDEWVDGSTLPQVQMPNRDGFVQDPRPDVEAATPGLK